MVDVTRDPTERPPALTSETFPRLLANKKPRLSVVFKMVDVIGIEPTTSCAHFGSVPAPR